MSSSYEPNSNLVLHVLVVGFHHKKGCQVEYSYPPLNGTDDTDECPSGWKYLPTLALPDGSHNYSHDTVYFHLPSLADPNKTVFGISCYRQISVDKVKNRTADLTRDTVQKSVCVLSKVPLYGHIEVKISLITHAYFEEGDFTKVSLLKDTYEHLNLCLNEVAYSEGTPQFFYGLSAKEFVLKFRHKALILFKLLLLEKRVIFYCSPVRVLCSTIISLLSLFPGMLEHGLQQSACIRPSRPMSPVPSFQDEDDIPVPESEHIVVKNDDKDSSDVSLKRSSGSFVSDTYGSDKLLAQNSSTNFSVKFSRCKDLIDDNLVDQELLSSPNVAIPPFPSKNNDDLQLDNDDDGEGEMNIEANVTIQTNLSIISQLDLSDCNIPLQIFTDGYLCLPYLSLPYMDLITDRNVRGFVIGATNILFKQKKQLSDVLVEIDKTRIETDNELKRLLYPTTEDLRFADYILKHVTEEKQDVFVDDVGWEGGDEWIRVQFKLYLFSMLRTSLLPVGSRELEHFNSAFLSAWKDTNNYKVWAFSHSDAINSINPCHPFAGQLSVADMKLRLSHTMQNTEGGRKLVTTGKAVGGALMQARGAVSNWWTNLTNNSVNEPSNIQETSNVKSQ